MGAITQDEVFEITEKEASGKGRLLKEEGTLVRKAPLNFKVTLQGGSCPKYIKATGPRLAYAHLQSHGWTKRLVSPVQTT